MGHYSIYWIKNEFAFQYFHKSGILYRLFKEYHTNKNDVDLLKQYNFITNTFPSSSLKMHLKCQLEDKYTFVANGNYIEISGKSSHMALHIDKKQINFRCDMIHDAEDLLFPALRSFHPFLFIIRNDFRNYGWISPFLHESAYLHGQVLYS